MVKIKTIVVGYLQTNCYILTSDDYDGAVIIDAGGNYEKIRDYIALEGKKPTAVILTHGHFDHILAVSKLSNDGAKIYIHSDDKDMLLGSDKFVLDMGLEIDSVIPDFLLQDDENLIFGDIKLRVIHTPGHTKGGVCLVLNCSGIFSGDTIFYLSYGRTDFEGGSLHALKNSIINKVFILEKDYIIYPGHGETTSLLFEKQYNPILGD